MKSYLCFIQTIWVNPHKKISIMIQSENGALMHKSSGQPLLDLNFKIPTLRGLDKKSFVENFALAKEAYDKDPLLFCKWLFFLRDCRSGMGEKNAFHSLFTALAYTNSEYAKRLVDLIPYYGSWKDVVELLFCPLPTLVNLSLWHMVALRLRLDLEAVENKRPQDVSLLGKWLPSINAGKVSRNRAMEICRILKTDHASYRKALASLREALKIVERDLCAQRYGEINYSAVPSVAGLKYSRTFIRHDLERYKKYILAVAEGREKINTSVLYPHEIYDKYCNHGEYDEYGEYDEVYEQYWKNLPNKVTDANSTLVVCDGSSSMLQSVAGGSTTALSVARSLAIYFSEKLEGAFANKFITFSSCPQMVDLSHCKSLLEKIQWMQRYDDCSNTDIEKTFQVILNAAINANTPQELMPKNVLIISDMEFDGDVCQNMEDKKALFDRIAQTFREHGYQMPKIIFWNVNSRTNGIPMRENENGVILVSGFSVNICDMVCSGETDPYECLLSVLNGERYDNVATALLPQDGIAETCP